MSKFIVLVFIFFTIQSGFSANILLFFSGGTYSHEISVAPLVKRLAPDHNLTFLSSHVKKPFNLPEVEVIAPQSLIDYIHEKYFDEKVSARLNYGELNIWYQLPEWSVEICDLLINSDDPFLKNFFEQRKFDLVIIDAVLCDCGFIAAHIFNAKTILYDSTTVLSWYFDIYDLPRQSSWIPQMTTNFKFPMGLYERTLNYLDGFYWTLKRRLQMYPAMERIMAKFYGDKNIPSFLELERNVSIVFLNTHYSTDFSRSLPPYFIQIGGLQCWDEDVQIPKDIQAFMDKADKVVLIAFGSSVETDMMPPEIIKSIFDALQKLDHIHFVWKWKPNSSVKVPKNILLTEWLPQKEILGHKKTVAFITHCGLNSIMEATFASVPLIGLPLFADQDSSGYRIQSDKIGIRLEVRELTKEILYSAVNEITTNKLYSDNMKKFSRAFRDRPMRPMDTALFWINYVLTHDDFRALKPEVGHLSYIQFYLLDVVGLAFALLLILTISLLVIIKYLISKAKSTVEVSKKKTAIKNKKAL